MNKNIKAKFKENNLGLPLIKLKKSLDELKNVFEKIFNSGIYEKLLEKIKELQVTEKAKE